MCSDHVTYGKCSRMSWSVFKGLLTTLLICVQGDLPTLLIEDLKVEQLCIPQMATVLIISVDLNEPRPTCRCDWFLLFSVIISHPSFLGSQYIKSYNLLCTNNNRGTRKSGEPWLRIELNLESLIIFICESFFWKFTQARCTQYLWFFFLPLLDHRHLENSPVFEVAHIHAFHIRVTNFNIL